MLSLCLVLCCRVISLVVGIIIRSLLLLLLDCRCHFLMLCLNLLVIFLVTILVYSAIYSLILGGDGCLTLLAAVPSAALVGTCCFWFQWLQCQRCWLLVVEVLLRYQKRHMLQHTGVQRR